MLSAGELASFVFFIYCSAVAMALPPAPRNRVLLRAAGGLLTTMGWVASAPWPIVHGWILPPLVLLAAYWASGALFTEPSPRSEQRLAALDSALSIRRRSAAAPRIVAELLEIAYVCVYPLIPVSLALHLLFTPQPDAQRFWGVILITDYVCFGWLPFVQTRPPRVLEGGTPWRSTVRTLNLSLIERASIGANTFPSGHAAEALAAALLVLGAPAWIVGTMFVVAVAIGAGAVFGRYHFAADALTGYAVAVVVWLLM